MGTNTTIELINGEYDQKSGLDLVLNLINTKIHFYSVNYLSLLEMTGKKDIESTRQLEKLKKTKTQILQLMRESDSQENKMLVQSTLEIKLLK